jgi:hypothetical protein
MPDMNKILERLTTTTTTLHTTDRKQSITASILAPSGFLGLPRLLFELLNHQPMLTASIGGFADVIMIVLGS